MKIIYLLGFALCFCIISGCKTTKTSTTKISTEQYAKKDSIKPEGTFTTLDGKTEPFYLVTETPPQFKNLEEKFSEYAHTKLLAPILARQRILRGIVQVSFIVEKTGRTSNAAVIKEAHPTLDDIAIDFIKEMPNWIPATVDGKAVNSKVILPLFFK